MSVRVRTISPISPTEVEPGLVAHFDVWLLAAHPGVKCSWAHLGHKARPFLCLAVQSGRSWWTPLSTKPINESGRRRLRILPAWKQGGGVGFHQFDTYLHDSRDVAVVPTSAVPEMTHKELGNSTRSRLSPDGLAACLLEIKTARHLRRTEIPDLPDPAAAEGQR